MKSGSKFFIFIFIGDKYEKYIFDGQRPTLQYSVSDTEAKL